MGYVFVFILYICSLLIALLLFYLCASDLLSPIYIGGRGHWEGEGQGGITR